MPWRHGDPGAGVRVEVWSETVGHGAIEELGEKSRERGLQFAQMRPEAPSRAAVVVKRRPRKATRRPRARRPRGGMQGGHVSETQGGLERAGRRAMPTAVAVRDDGAFVQSSRIGGRARVGSGCASGGGATGSGGDRSPQSGGAEKRSLAGFCTKAVAAAKLPYAEAELVDRLIPGVGGQSRRMRRHQRNRGCTLVHTVHT